MPLAKQPNKFWPNNRINFGQTTELSKNIITFVPDFIHTITYDYRLSPSNH